MLHAPFVRGPQGSWGSPQGFNGRKIRHVPIAIHRFPIYHIIGVVGTPALHGLLENVHSSSKMMIRWFGLLVPRGGTNIFHKVPQIRIAVWMFEPIKAMCQAVCCVRTVLGFLNCERKTAKGVHCFAFDSIGVGFLICGAVKSCPGDRGSKQQHQHQHQQKCSHVEQRLLVAQHCTEPVERRFDPIKLSLN